MIKQRVNGFNIINYCLLFLICFICFYPFYYVFIYSISDPSEAAKGVYMYPRGFSLSTYLQVFKLNNLLHSVWISVLRTVSGTILTLFCCSLFAYFLSKREMLFRVIIYRIVIASMYLNAGLVAVYLTYSGLGLKDNFLVYILPLAVTGFYIVLIKTFIEQLPPSIEEAAMIDGAGYLTMFFKVVFPLSLPILATIAIFSAVNHWNTWIDGLLFISNPRLITAQYVLYNYLSQAEAIAQVLRTNAAAVNGIAIQKTTPEAIKMTITLVITLPIILVYPFFQRFFVQGLLVGAVKG
jgi:putative aldouronate transport system permease protein